MTPQQSVTTSQLSNLEQITNTNIGTLSLSSDTKSTTTVDTTVAQLLQLQTLKQH